MIKKKLYFSTLRQVLNKYDLMLIVILVILSLFIYIQLGSTKNSRVAIIHLEGKIIKEVNLSQDVIVDINVFIEAEVKDGKIRLIKNNCKNQFCVKQGWTNNLPIICVPNKLFIEIKSKNDKDMIITY